MNSQKQIIVNFILFQLGWFSCVLMAAQGLPETGIVMVLLLVCIQFFLATNRKNLLILITIVTVIGSAWDSVMTSLGVLVFEAGMIVSFLAPGWIIAMWLMFATTLNISFRWLFGRYWLAMLLGAICGPLTYQAGAAMSAVVIPDNLLANSVIAAGWAFLMPLYIKLAERLYVDEVTGGKL
ncbi:MAG: DUF2878 domain-containing protein [Gammaproteobacteria bacterium]|nr:DUF2878 domain-containing protein [Gammaproteobacteria bacterium]